MVCFADNKLSELCAHDLVQLPFWSRPRPTSTPGTGDTRGQRTVYLLVSVVLVFVASWLPLNLINILSDLGHLELCVVNI